MGTTTSSEMQQVLAAIPADFADPRADYHAVRAMFARFHGHPIGPDLQIEIVSDDGVRWGSYTLSGTTASFTAFHCHGGAFVSTPLDEYHFYAEMLARQLGARVVMPDYRLAPEHRYPAAHDDCYHAWRQCVARGTEPGSCVLFGESCGGSLAVGLLTRLRDEGLPMPAAFVSLTGWYDLSVAGDPAPGHDPFLTAEWVRNRARDYVGDALALDDPRISPAYADLAGLPPMYLQVGEYDTVRNGNLLLARNAEAAGVAVQVEHWPGMVQGWHGLANAGVPEAKAAWQAIGNYVAGVLAPR